jgi:uncharacterized protein
MAASVIVDAGFIVAILSRRDTHHRWARETATRFPPPWQTCEAVVSEAAHLLGRSGRLPLHALLRRQSLTIAFDLRRELEPVLRLIDKYATVPMSLADACLVRMTEIHADPILLTTDADFRIYRRHSRHVVPCAMP